MFGGVAAVIIAVVAIVIAVSTGGNGRDDFRIQVAAPPVPTEIPTSAVVPTPILATDIPTQHLCPHPHLFMFLRHLYPGLPAVILMQRRAYTGRL